MNQKTLTISAAVVIFAILFGVVGCFIWIEKSFPVISIQAPASTTANEYRNIQYGFSFALPVSWKGYSILTDKWEGHPLDGQNPVKIEGPKILIRHPQWTATNPRQDIPIMIFTTSQWDLIQQEKLSVGAAPIGPSELGRNTKYVFALPARYNYAFPTGWEEVENILHLYSKPLPLQGF